VETVFHKVFFATAFGFVGCILFHAVRVDVRAELCTQGSRIHVRSLGEIYSTKVPRHPVFATNLDKFDMKMVSCFFLANARFRLRTMSVFATEARFRIFFSAWHLPVRAQCTLQNVGKFRPKAQVLPEVILSRGHIYTGNKCYTKNMKLK
jgi:hypothetical protein